MLLSNIPYSP